MALKLRKDYVTKQESNLTIGSHLDIWGMLTRFSRLLELCTNKNLLNLFLQYANYFYIL